MPFSIGLDLGQRQDHTALAIVERARNNELHLRYVERIPLGTSYPDVVSRVREVTTDPALINQCGLAVDATGVGAPVVQMLHFAGLGCEITPVSITSGESESERNGGWCVPKRDLITGVLVSLEQRDLRIARDMPNIAALLEELTDMRSTQNQKGRVRLGADGCDEHDDLVIALSLACWLAKRRPKLNSFGKRRLF